MEISSYGKSSGLLSVYSCMLLAALVSQEKETSFYCSKETLLYIFITFNIKMYNRLMMQGATGEIWKIFQVLVHVKQG